MDKSMLKSAGSAIIVGCGYVGSRVAAMWQKRGIRVFVVTRSETKARTLAATGLEPIVLDLSQDAPIQRLPDADMVLWCVGFDRTSGISKEAIWIEGLKRLLRSLPERTEIRRILYTSSTSIYGDGSGQDVDELTSPNPLTESGKTCLAAERVLQDYAAQHSDSVSILRLAGIYGPNRLLRRISDLQQSVPIRSPPDEWLNLIHVDDAVAVIDIVSRLESPPTVMNVVAQESATRRDYYATLASIADAPSPVFADPVSTTVSQDSRRGGNRRVVSIVRSKLSINFQYDSIVDGLRQAIQ